MYNLYAKYYMIQNMKTVKKTCLKQPLKDWKQKHHNKNNNDEQRTEKENKSRYNTIKTQTFD